MKRALHCPEGDVIEWLNTIIPTLGENGFVNSVLVKLFASSQNKPELGIFAKKAFQKFDFSSINFYCPKDIKLGVQFLYFLKKKEIFEDSNI